MRFGLLVVAGTLAAMLTMAAPTATAQEGPDSTAKVEAQEKSTGSAMIIVGGFVAAAFVVGVSVLGAGVAVARVGAAAMGAVAERPELMGRSMIYVGLAEGLAIYGLIVAIIILGKLPI